MPSSAGGRDICPIENSIDILSELLFKSHSEFSRWYYPPVNLGFLGELLRTRTTARIYHGINFKPPVLVAKVARLSLIYRRKFKRGGTRVGIMRAVQLARRDPVSPDVIRRMNSYFARHAVDRRPGWSNPSNPTNGWIAWLMWGGDPGRVWAARVLRQMKARERVY